MTFLVSGSSLGAGEGWKANPSESKEFFVHGLNGEEGFGKFFG